MSLCQTILITENTRRAITLVGYIPFILMTCWTAIDTKSSTSFGYGASSTVWLCSRYPCSKNMLLWKIKEASISQLHNELDILKHKFSESKSEHSGRVHSAASLLLRQFWIKGPNGRHLALVFRVCGPSISRLYGWNIRSSPLQSPKYTNYYAAPEVLFGWDVTFYSDIWAIGCLIYVIRDSLRQPPLSSRYSEHTPRSRFPNYWAQKYWGWTDQSSHHIYAIKGGTRIQKISEEQPGFSKVPCAHQNWSEHPLETFPIR